MERFKLRCFKQAVDANKKSLHVNHVVIALPTAWVLVLSVKTLRGLLLCQRFVQFLIVSLTLVYLSYCLQMVFHMAKTMFSQLIKTFPG